MEFNPYQSPPLFGGSNDVVDPNFGNDDRVRNEFVIPIEVTQPRYDVAWRKIEEIQIRAARVVVLVALLLTLATVLIGVFVEPPAWIMFSLIAAVFWLSAIVEPMKIRRHNRKIRQRQDIDVEKFSVGFSRKGLEWREKSSTRLVSWEQFIGMREVDGLWLLCCSNDRFWVLEKKQLSSKAEKYLRDRIRIL
jgi:hypothetical protein